MNKQVIEKIRAEIEASKGTRIWKDYINTLNLVAQVVFTRSTGFILELIQNAEDSGLGSNQKGVFEIRINKKRIKITHNGHLFTENDVNALCGIRSSKKPERGTLGYLGIGFKSVFKISDRPEIYSGDFQFKFDRTAWNDPRNTPWHVIPLCIDAPSESIDIDKTTFIIPFREEACYLQVYDELKKLKTELYLFLRWLKKIKVIDEVSEDTINGTWILEDLGENEEGFTVLKHDDKEQRFKFFRDELKVPDWVKDDRLTQEFRANVAKREIAIAFSLDEAGNLAPSEAGAMYGGVYSFSPLGEAKSGAKFPIQADFLVQPGRDAINYEAQWNHWLLDGVSTLCKKAIEHFKNHSRWKYQFFPVFEFTKNMEYESYTKLFGPKLIDPIEKFLKEDSCVPVVDGGWATINQVARLTEDSDASESLIAMGIVGKGEIGIAMSADANLKLVHPDVKDAKSNPIKQINRWDLLKNTEFLKMKTQIPESASWFRNLYLWLLKYPFYEEYFHYKKKKRVKMYHEYEIILTTRKTLMKGGDVSIIGLDLSDSNLIEEVGNSLNSMLLHQDILSPIKDLAEQEDLKGFLIRFTGLQTIDKKKVCKEVFLPKILSIADLPTSENLLKHTIYCHQILGDEIEEGNEFWILTAQGKIKPAREIIFSKRYRPEQDWETNQQYITGVNFISQRYIEGMTDEVLIGTWRNFFRKGGVRESPDNGVEEFAMKYAEEKMQSILSLKNVKVVDKRNYGYDIEAEKQNGEKVSIEVKGQSSEKDVELTGNETEAADKYADSFYLCVVSSIPNEPKIYWINNPAKIGKKEKLTIPQNLWKSLPMIPDA